MNVRIWYLRNYPRSEKWESRHHVGSLAQLHQPDLQQRLLNVDCWEQWHRNECAWWCDGEGTQGKELRRTSGNSFCTGNQPPAFPKGPAAGVPSKLALPWHEPISFQKDLSGQEGQDNFSFFPSSHWSICVMGPISMANLSLDKHLDAAGPRGWSRFHFPLIIPHKHSYPITHSPPCHETIPAHSC